MGDLNVELIRTECCYGCDVVLLFCAVISRAGSDVEEAMMRISDADKPKDVILVLMYHTRGDFPTDTVQWSSSYPQVKLHVDVLFHESMNGLLKCDKNEQAIQKLRDYVKHLIK